MANKYNINTHRFRLASALIATLALTSACGDFDDKKSKAALAKLEAQHTDLKRELDNSKAALLLKQNQCKFQPAQPVASATCTNEISQLKAEHQRLKSKLESTEKERNKLKSDITGEQKTSQKKLADLTQTLETLKSSYDQAQKQLESKLKNVERERDRLKTSTAPNALRNPTWQDLKDFLAEDKTDELVYTPKVFDCTGFAITLRNNAHAKGFRAAYVEIGLDDSNVGHALNLFETSDKGAVYVDAQGDVIAYVEIGRQYRTIEVKFIIDTQLECNNYDDCFEPLKEAPMGDLFKYTYFDKYEARRANYNRTVDAFKAAQQARNQEVLRYKAASRVERTTVWLARIETRVEQLNAWLANIDLLSPQIHGMGGSNQIVTHIETIW